MKNLHFLCHLWQRKVVAPCLSPFVIYYLHHTPRFCRARAWRLPQQSLPPASQGSGPTAPRPATAAGAVSSQFCQDCNGQQIEGHADLQNSVVNKLYPVFYKLASKSAHLYTFSFFLFTTWTLMGILSPVL